MVIEGLRKTLAASRSAKPFIEELESRVRQLIGDMVDGRVLAKADADALRSAVFELVREEALPLLAARNPQEAIRVLGLLKAYRYTQLEDERARLEAMRDSRFPPPRAADWPELAELRAAAADPRVCKIEPPVTNVYFAHELAEQKAPLPDEILALYAWADGFDLSCRGAPHVPVFALLPGKSVAECEGTPRHVTAFEGGDEVQLCVYRDRRTKEWWLAYEYDFDLVGKKPLDIRELLRFAIRRMNAPSFDVLNEELRWERFFDARS